MFRSTISETLKSSFPLATPESISIKEVEFKIQDLNLRQMITQCFVSNNDSGTDYHFRL